MKTIAIITAGGTGKRLPGGCKKQYRQINGKPVLAHAIDIFYNHPYIDGTIVTAPQGYLDEAINILHPFYPPENLTVLEGGPTRQDSVRHALNAVPEEAEYVMIHDGVRLMIPPAEVSILLELCRKHQAVIPVHKVKNTVKEIKDNKVVRTINRDHLVEVYTPQAFRRELIVSCHWQSEREGLNFTDDAAVLEYYNIPVYVHETARPNIKITDEFDYELVKLLIEMSYE